MPEDEMSCPNTNKTESEHKDHALKLIYHITYGPGVPEHRAGNRINALVQYRFLRPRFALIILLQTGNK